MPKAPHPVVTQLQTALRFEVGSDAAIAAAMGCATSNVRGWFSGRAPINFRQVSQLAKLANKELALVDEDPPAIHLLKELTETLTADEIDPERLRRCVKASKVFLRAGDVQ